MNDDWDDVGADEDDVLAALGVSGDEDDDDDVSGDDVVSGEDLLELVGATRRRGRLKKGSLARLARAFRNRGKKSKMRTHLSRLNQLTKAGRIPQIHIAVNSIGNVVTLTTAVIRVVPSVPIRITDFFTDPNLAPSFTIASMLMGRLNFLGTGDAVSAAIFDPSTGAQRAPIEVRKVPAGSPIDVSVTNISAADAPFRASFQCIDLGTRVY